VGEMQLRRGGTCESVEERESPDVESLGHDALGRASTLHHCSEIEWKNADEVSTALNIFDITRQKLR